MKQNKEKLDFTKYGAQLFVSNPFGNFPAVLLRFFTLYIAASAI